MKKLLLTLLLVASAARADTPPPTSVYQLKAPGGNGLIVSTSSRPALVTTTHTGWLATWNGTTVDFEAPPAGGVTSVGLLLPSSVFTISGSPVTSTGTLTGTFATQAANQAFMGPVNGSPGVPGFRSLVAADVPSLDASKITTGQGTLTTSTTGVTVTGTNAGLAAMTVNVQTASGSQPGLLSAADWTTFNGKQSTLTIGNLTDAGTDGIVVTGGTGSVIGSGTSFAQHVADATHNGYLLSTDWSTFNSKGAGTVTTISVASANGLAGSSSGGATPALTLTTSITGLLKGNGTAISAASSGTDYALPNANTTGSAGSVLSTTSNPASTGTVKLANTDAVNWRNAGNTADTGISIDANNAFSVGSSAQAITSVVIGKGSTATGTPSNITIQPTNATGSNIVGGNLKIAAGNGTGTGGSGFIQFSTAPAGTTGSSANTLATIGQWTDAGLEIGTTTRQANVGLYIQQPNASNYGGIQLANQAGSTVWGIDAVGGNFRIAQTGQNFFMIVNGSDWISLSNASGTGPFYAFEYSQPAGSTKPTLLSGFVPNSGSSVPAIVMRSRATTANGLSGFLVAGSSDNTTTIFGDRAITVTSGSEDSDAFIANQNAGTLTEHLRIKPKGQYVTLGTPPAAGTCGSSPGAPTGNDNFFKITSGTGGSSGTCAVTLATAPLTAGKCNCRDKTTVSTVVDADVSGSVVTMTTYSRTTGLAANFAASDVFECQCSFF